MLPTIDRAPDLVTECSTSSRSSTTAIWSRSLCSVISMVLSVRRGAWTWGRRRRRSDAPCRAARDVLVGPPRPRSSRFSRFAGALSGFAGALACAAAGGASVVAAGCAVPAPAGFLRRRRRRLLDAGRSDPPSGEAVAGVASAPTAPSASAVSAVPAAALSFPAPSSAALGFDGRRRDRERERPPALFFFGSPVDPAASFSTVPAAPPPPAP